MQTKKKGRNKWMICIYTCWLPMMIVVMDWFDGKGTLISITFFSVNRRRNIITIPAAKPVALKANRNCLA